LPPARCSDTRSGPATGEQAENHDHAFGNSSGLYVNRFLESGKSFNSAYFIDYVPNDIERLPPLQTAVQQKKRFVLYMSNSLAHKSPAVTEKVPSLRLEFREEDRSLDTFERAR
jgi:hypothetical protein